MFSDFRRVFAAVLFFVFCQLLNLPLLPREVPAAKKEKIRTSVLVDLNQASIEELETLPGIGKITARNIVTFREKNGPFRRVEELLIIRGMSEKRLRQILGQITVGAAGQRPVEKKSSRQPK